jgi:hypothetical protein
MASSSTLGLATLPPAAAGAVSSAIARANGCESAMTAMQSAARNWVAVRIAALFGRA